MAAWDQPLVIDPASAAPAVIAEILWSVRSAVATPETFPESISTVVAPIRLDMKRSCSRRVDQILLMLRQVASEMWKGISVQPNITVHDSDGLKTEAGSNAAAEMTDSPVSAASGTQFLQGVRKGFLPGRVELFDPGLQQRAN
jgi:hypothetical protein